MDVTETEWKVSDIINVAQNCGRSFLKQERTWSFNKQ
jgi:hypothetical protein